tara:strand:- start:698 stop:1654 length:957 start_codon:yes stop_codon:yes gene_type:complete
MSEQDGKEETGSVEGKEDNSVAAIENTKVSDNETDTALNPTLEQESQSSEEEDQASRATQNTESDSSADSDNSNADVDDERLPNIYISGKTLVRGVQDASNLGLIEDTLEKVHAKVKDLKDPSDREWTKAKSLILLLSGITGLVMISAITFFIVMSVTISQKVAELDRVMLAVAKRGMQLGDGIESIVEMESKLLEIIEQNNPIPSSLADIERKLSLHGETLVNNDKSVRTLLQSQIALTLENQNGVKTEMVANIGELQRDLIKLINYEPLIMEQSQIRQELENLNATVIEMQGKVHDLYVIKQAEIESAYLGLTVNE